MGNDENINLKNIITTIVFIVILFAGTIFIVDAIKKGAPSELIDLDGDGYDTTVDCDDDDNIFPTAEDIPGDNMKIEIKEEIGNYKKTITFEGNNVDNLLTRELANDISKYIIDSLKIKDKK